MWLGAWVCLFWTSRQLVCQKWTVTYQCQYFTINSCISECDHKCETWNAEPEIGTDGSSQTRQIPRVEGYGSGFGLPRVSCSGFWMGLEPNRPVFAVQTRTAGGLPAPVAYTSITLLAIITIILPLLSSTKFSPTGCQITNGIPCIPQTMDRLILNYIIRMEYMIHCWIYMGKTSCNQQSSMQCTLLKSVLFHYLMESGVLALFEIYHL